MERFLRSSLALFVLLFTAALLVSACSDDSPSGPNVDPTDTTGTNDTTGNTDTTGSMIRDTLRPIIFVHGYMEASDVYTQMCQLFFANGYQDAQLRTMDFVSYFTGRDADIQKMTTQLMAAIDDALNETGADRVDVVAHGVAAQAVQRCLVNMGGTDKIAHVAILGGLIDASLKVDGDITPAPCKYLTLRSDGNDALQNGDANAGMMEGADNRQYAGFDHLQLSSNPTAFLRVFTFFTGSAPSELSLPRSRVGTEYNLSGKVIDFFDNTPVKDAMVIITPIRQKSDGTIERQSGFIATQQTGSDGVFTAAITPGLEQYFELRVVSQVGSHYDMHIYRQPFRANSSWERLRMVPKNGGSAILSEFSSAMVTGDHAITILHSQNKTFRHDINNVKAMRYDQQFTLMSEVELLGSANAPSPGTPQLGNTFMVCLLDYNMDRQDTPGPIAVPALNMYGVSSYDLFQEATITGYQTHFEFDDALILGAFNFRSSGGAGASNSGFNLVQYEYQAN